MILLRTVAGLLSSTITTQSRTSPTQSAVALHLLYYTPFCPVLLCLTLCQVSDGPQKRKIDACFALVQGQTKVIPLLHGYGPDDDFHRRVRVVAESQAEGVWVNRYGYLSDRKLESIRLLLGAGVGEAPTAASL